MLDIMFCIYLNAILLHHRNAMTSIELGEFVDGLTVPTFA